MNTDMRGSNVANETRIVVRPRRWLIHVGWFMVAVILFIAGMSLGMRWSGATLGSLAMTNQRNERFDVIRIAVGALDSNDTGGARKALGILLYDATLHLAGMPRYVACSARERDLLGRAKAYLERDMPSHDEAARELRSASYAYCDRPVSEVNLP